jgi:hypothetical protein
VRRTIRVRAHWVRVVNGATGRRGQAAALPAAMDSNDGHDFVTPMSAVPDHRPTHKRVMSHHVICSRSGVRGDRAVDSVTRVCIWVHNVHADVQARKNVRAHAPLTVVV